MTAILSYLVDSDFLRDRTFQYQETHLKKSGSEEYRQIPHPNRPTETINKVYNYYRDTSNNQVRIAEEPHQVKSLFGLFAIATAVLFTATCALRAVQVALIALTLPGVFFRTFKESFQHREEKDFPEILFNVFEAKVKDQGKAFYSVGSSFKLDIQCALTMETTAIVALFSKEMNKVIQMQVIFSTMERKWNQGKSPDYSCIVIWTRLLRDRNLKTFSEWMNVAADVRRESNGSFYLYPCAQPVDEVFLARIAFFPAIYNSYQEIVDKYIEQVRRQEGQSVV